MDDPVQLLISEKKAKAHGAVAQEDGQKVK